MAQYDIDLRDYWRILKKRKSIVVFVVLLMGIFSYGFSKLREPSPLYKATSSVKIERMGSLASLILETFSVSSGDNISTQAYVIKSFPVLTQTAKELGLIPKDLSPEEIRRSEKYLSMIESLRSKIQTEQEGGTNIINIMVTSERPEEASKIANIVAKVYRDFNILERNKQTLESRDFLDRQLRLTWERLKQAEEELRTFKETYNLIALDTQTKDTLDRLTAAESDLENVDRKIKKVASQLKLIKDGQITSESLTGAFFLEDPDSPFRDLSAAFRKLSLEREALLFDYTEENPEIIEINTQIEDVHVELIKGLNLYLKTLETRKTELLENMNRLKQKNYSIPENALQLARLEREVKLHETLYTELKTKHQEIMIQESGKIEEVYIVRPAMVPTRPINAPSKAMTTVTGTTIGIILGIFLAFILESMDTSMGRIEEVESFLGVPVLGVIPSMEMQKKAKERGKRRNRTNEGRRGRYLVTHFEPKSLVAEAYRALRTSFQSMRAERNGKVFLVTSSSLREGKTVNVVNLALTLTQAGDKVLLIEADLRKPAIYGTFELAKEPGLTDYILGNYQWREVVNTITDVMLGGLELEDILKTPGLDNLSIMTAGTIPPNPSEILTSPGFDELMKEARGEYDVILLDAPPVLPMADAAEIGPKVDGTVLVYQVGKTARWALKRTKLTLDNVNAKIGGVILNNVKPQLAPDYYRYQYGYYYGYIGENEKSESRIAPVGATSNVARSVSQWRAFPYLIIFLAFALLSVGVFWKDLASRIYRKETSLGPSSERIQIPREKTRQNISIPDGSGVGADDILTDKQKDDVPNEQKEIPSY